MPQKILDTNSEITLQHIKCLLGAISYQFDQALINKGYNPEKLRIEFNKRYTYKSIILLEDCKFLSFNYGKWNVERNFFESNTVDVSTEIIENIRQLIIETIGEGNKYLVLKINRQNYLDKESHIHNTLGCWCSLKIELITDFVVFYIKNNKFDYFNISVTGIAIEINAEPEYYNNPVIVKKISIHEIMGFLLKYVCEEFGYEIVMNYINTINE